MVDKIANIVPTFINVARKEFRERFRRPEKDPNTGLYVDNVFGQNKDQILFVART